MAMTKVFPQNSLRVSCMAATTPHTVLMGTATNARRIVIFTCNVGARLTKLQFIKNQCLDPV